VRRKGVRILSNANCKLKIAKRKSEGDKALSKEQRVKAKRKKVKGIEFTP
jgi:hypothetical protein